VEKERRKREKERRKREKERRKREKERRMRKREKDLKHYIMPTEPVSESVKRLSKRQ
jgi:hypothetical protein